MLIAKYKFDSSLYDLIPEFNSGYTGYTYTDEKEIFRDFIWIPDPSENYPNGVISDFIAVEPNTTYKINMNYAHVFLYDSNKRYIKNLGMIGSDPALSDFFTTDENTTYIQLGRGAGTSTNTMEKAIVTRTIESDSLPTSMIFGSNLVNYVEGSEIALLEVLDMNTSELTNCYAMFRYCKNLTSITCEWDTTNVTNMGAMFYNCSSLTLLDLSSFDTTNVANMTYMFQNCSNLTSLDLSNFDTANVTSMGYMFHNCSNLTSLDVSEFDTTNVTRMDYMFYDCSSLTSLDVSNFNTANVVNMGYMFLNCSRLTKLDVSGFDTTKVNNMDSMFRHCQKLTSLDVSSWDVSKVTNINGIFYNCSSLTELDVSNWDTSNVVNFSTGYGVFQNTSIKKLDLKNWNIRKADYLWNTFFDSKLEILDISNWDLTDKNINNIFAHVTTLKYLKCNNVNTLNKLNTYLPTKSSTSQGIIICKSDVTNLDTTTLSSKNWNITDELTLVAKYVFDKSIHNNCIPEFNTEFEGYFIEDEVVEGSNEVVRVIESCGMLPTLMRFGTNWSSTDNSTNREKSLLSVFDMNMQELTTGYCMFYRCSNLTNVNSSIISAKMKTIANMFQHCTKIKSIDIILDTSNVTDMNSMFSSCNNLTSLDVSNFDTSKVTNMYAMFSNCNNLTTLDVSNFNTSNITNTTNMFYNTPLLADIGVLYMDKSSLQKLVNAMPTDLNKTLWYKDVDIDGITHGNNITLKKYIEENVEIILNSPLLEGDRIEVVDGKLCHYHKMGKVVLDGSGTISRLTTNSDAKYRFKFKVTNIKNAISSSDIHTSSLISDKYATTSLNDTWFNINSIALDTISGITFYHEDTCVKTAEDFKQWLQVNPITVIYELAEPYYEDITPYQSFIALRTFEECNVQINTALPIKTKITYRTNITSAIVMEQELDTLDSGVSLSNLIEEEVDE